LALLKGIAVSNEKYIRMDIRNWRADAMADPRVAKLFKNGASQAVRLPADFRFEGEQVYISRDEASGDVILSTRPGARDWREFFEFIHGIEAPPDFMVERPMNVLPEVGGVFDDVSASAAPRKGRRKP